MLSLFSILILVYRFCREILNIFIRCWPTSSLTSEVRIHPIHSLIVYHLPPSLLLQLLHHHLEHGHRCYDDPSESSTTPAPKKNVHMGYDHRFRTGKGSALDGEGEPRVKDVFIFRRKPPQHPSCLSIRTIMKA